MYYSTNPLMKTTYSVNRERLEKVRRIASEIDSTISFMNEADKWQNDPNYSFREFNSFICDEIYSHLHLSSGNRAERLSKLAEAVRRELLRRNNAL